MSKRTNYIYTVCLRQKLPNITTQRKSLHWMVVNAPDIDACKESARAVAQMVGIELDESDFVKINGGVRRSKYGGVRRSIL